MEYDVFISHASEDKDAVARPLAVRLQEFGIKVWLDEFELTLGDSLRRTIDRGLSQSKFGIVILSRNFFTKDWPQRELDGLAAREENNQKVILPVWHNITKEEIIKFSPTLGDRLAVSTVEGIEKVAQQVLRVVRKPPAEAPDQLLTQEKPKADITKTTAPKRRISIRGIPLLLAGAIVISLLLPFLLSRFNSTPQVTESSPTPKITPSPTPVITPSPTPGITELHNPQEAILKGCTFSDRFLELEETMERRGKSIDCIVFNKFSDKRIISIEIRVAVPTPNGFQVVRKVLPVSKYENSHVGLPLFESHYSGSIEYDGARLHSKVLTVSVVETSRAF